MAAVPIRGWNDSACPEVGAAREPCGRALRFACAEGELWRLPPGDAKVAERFVAWGASSLGGFVRGGCDAEGAWLVRRTTRRRLVDVARAERLSWRDALTVVK